MDILQDVQQQLKGFGEEIQSLKACRQHLESLSLTPGSIDGIDEEITRLVDLLKLKEVLSVFRDVNKVHQLIQESLSVTKVNLRRVTASPMKLVSNKPVDHDLKLMEAVDHFSDFKSLAQQRVFKACPPGNFLRSYVKKIMFHWHEVLLKELTPRFEQILSSINWPIISIESLNTSPKTSKKPVTSSFDNFFLSLLKIDIHDCLDDFPFTPEQHISLPMRIMIKPLKKRFHYHFMTTTRTNDLSKPEWFLTQVLNWIKDNSDFLDKNVDPLLRIQEKDYSSGKTQLTLALLELVYKKLEKDLPDIAFDDKSFSHCFDEVFFFQKELDLLMTEDSQFIHSIVDLLDLFAKTPAYFTKLLNLEKKRSSAYVDAILDSKTAWNSLSLISTNNGLLDQEDDEEDPMIPEAGDNFVLLIQSITERSICITDPTYKEAFIDLILELIDDFRLRLTQLTRCSIDELNDSENNSRWPFSARFYAIINTLNYLRQVMEEWIMTPFFLDEDLTSKIIDSPSKGHRRESREEKMRQTISLLQHMIQDIQSRIIDSFGQEVKQILSSLSSVKWFSNDSVGCVEGDLEHEGSTMKSPSIVQRNVMPLSPQECHVIHFVSASLSLVRNRLCKPIACFVIKSFATCINRLLIEEVILRSSFTSSGSERLNRFISQYLITLFRDFISRPEAHFDE
jgi:hypothetical protein